MKQGTIKKIIGYYTIWSFLHLVFLVLGWNGERHQYFWPFEHTGIKEAYDLSEFLVYAVGPVILIFSLVYIFEGDIENKLDDKMKK